MNAKLTVCTTLSQLKENEGERIEIQGTYQHPENLRLEQMKLVLTDGNAVILQLDAKNAELFSKANTGKKITLIGKFYDGKLPEKYELESSTNAPIIVDIEEAKLTGE